PAVVKGQRAPPQKSHPRCQFLAPARPSWASSPPGRVNGRLPIAPLLRAHPRLLRDASRLLEAEQLSYPYEHIGWALSDDANGRIVIAKATAPTRREPRRLVQAERREGGIASVNEHRRVLLVRVDWGL